MFDIRYRLWLLSTLARSVILPLGAVHIGLRFLPLPLLGRVVVYVLTVPSLHAITYNFGRWRDDVAARRLGIPQLPRIKGRSLGNLDIAQRLAQEDYAGDILDRLLDEAGCDTARVSILWSTDIVITRDPDVFKYALNGGFPHEFVAVEDSDIRVKSFWGSGIFGVNGEKWKAHRALARPHFAKDQITDYKIFGRYINKLLVILRKHGKTGSPIDVQDLFSRFTLDTSGEFLFGTADLNTLDLALPKAGSAQLGPRGTLMPPSAYSSFGQAFDQAQHTVLKRAMAGDLVWTMQELFSDRLAPSMKAIHAYLTPLAQAALQRKDKRRDAGQLGDDDETGKSFIDHLADNTDDMEGIRDQLLNILLAARDTTACLLSFACYNLAKHPSIMTRLREDILSAIGDSETPHYEDLRKIKYLRAVLNETLRLFPPVSMGFRVTLVPCTLPTSTGPVYLPRAGIKVLLSDTGLHKRKDLWGDNANQFNPDRWLHQREAMAASSKFVPFGGGPRVCLGQDFAYNEASFVLVRILQNFDSFTVAQKDAAPAGSLPPAEWANLGGRKAVEEIVPLPSITLFSKGGLWLRMHSTEDSS